MGGWEKLMEELKNASKNKKKDTKVDRSGLEQLELSDTVPKDTTSGGVRIGQKNNRNFKAVKVWDKENSKILMMI